MNRARKCKAPSCHGFFLFVCFSPLLLPVGNLPSVSLVQEEERKQVFWAEGVYKAGPACAGGEKQGVQGKREPWPRPSQESTLFSRTMLGLTLAARGSLTFLQRYIGGQIWIRVLWFYCFHFSLLKSVKACCCLIMAAATTVTTTPAS